MTLDNGFPSNQQHLSKMMDWDRAHGIEDLYWEQRKQLCLIRLGLNVQIAALTQTVVQQREKIAELESTYEERLEWSSVDIIVRALRRSKREHWPGMMRRAADRLAEMEQSDYERAEKRVEELEALVGVER